MGEDTAVIAARPGRRNYPKSQIPAGLAYGLMQVVCSWLLFSTDPAAFQPIMLPIHLAYVCIVAAMAMNLRRPGPWPIGRELALMALLGFLLSSTSMHSGNEASLFLAAAASFVLLVSGTGVSGLLQCLAGLVVGVFCLLLPLADEGITPLSVLAAIGWVLALVFRLYEPSAHARLQRDVELGAGADIAFLEAQRHQEEINDDVRLMHDTVLRTLTVVARRGASLDVAVLQAMAKHDLNLLAGQLPEQVHAQSHEETVEVVVGATPGSRGVGAALMEGQPAGESGPELSSPEPSSPEPSSTESRIHGIALAFGDSTFGVLIQGGIDGARLEPRIEDALCGAVTECVVNARKYAGTDSVNVLLSAGPDFVSVVVTDSGQGFDPETVPSKRIGLRNSVVNRIDAIGGRARIFSVPGMGTSVALEVPCAVR